MTRLRIYFLSIAFREYDASHRVIFVVVARGCFRMKVLFITSHSYIPQFFGGSEVSTDQLIRFIKQKNHDSVVLCKIKYKNDLRGLLYRCAERLSASKCIRDTVSDYFVYRSSQPMANIPYVIEKESPTVAVIQSGEQLFALQKCSECNIPTIVYLRDVNFAFSHESIKQFPEVLFVANSAYTASEFFKYTGRKACIIPPLVLPHLYKNESPGDKVLLVNPNHQKGIDVGLKLAEKHPEIQFLFVEGWGLPKDLLPQILQRSNKLPNVLWRRSTKDMRSVYAQTKILLCPSGTPFYGQPVDWVEAWGRVVTEAQFSGIPVIATNDGGLPESVGPGGILIEKTAPIEKWSEALASLWKREEVYKKYSTLARNHGKRQDIALDYLGAKFEALLYQAIRPLNTQN